MVIVVGIALSVCLLGQLFSPSFICTILWFLCLDLHCRIGMCHSFMVLFAILVHCQFDLCRCFIHLSDNWVSFSTVLNCQITLHIDSYLTIIFRLFFIATVIFSIVTIIFSFHGNHVFLLRW